MSYIIGGCDKCGGTIERTPNVEAFCLNCGKEFPTLTINTKRRPVDNFYAPASPVIGQHAIYGHSITRVTW